MMSLAKAIIQEDVHAVEQWLNHGADPNELDEYGFTPLIESMIVENATIAQILIARGADANGQDILGNTPLHWAAENNNLGLTRLLLSQQANPNAHNFSGQPTLVMPILRNQAELRKCLYQAGADETFARDFINVKLLGHMFELVGIATIVDPKNQFVEVDFEGFYLDITLGLIGDSLAQFQNNYGSRRLRRFLAVSQMIVDALSRASELVKYRQYRVDVKKHRAIIFNKLRQEPLVIPIGYEGHAITFVKYGNILAKCDRREDSRLYDNIMFYRVNNLSSFTPELIMHLMYDKQTGHFINKELPHLLDFVPLTELQVESQISGNCSWANVEALIPALFFLYLSSNDTEESSIPHYKSLASYYFNRWREWNKERALQFCMQSFKEASTLRKATKAEILAAILFQRCDSVTDRERMRDILTLLAHSPYQYILLNYLQTYYYRSPTEEGARYAKVLRDYGVIKS